MQHLVASALPICQGVWVLVLPIALPNFQRPPSPTSNFCGGGGSCFSCSRPAPQAPNTDDQERLRKIEEAERAAISEVVTGSNMSNDDAILRVCEAMPPPPPPPLVRRFSRAPAVLFCVRCPVSRCSILTLYQSCAGQCAITGDGRDKPGRLPGHARAPKVGQRFNDPGAFGRVFVLHDPRGKGALWWWRKAPAV